MTQPRLVREPVEAAQAVDRHAEAKANVRPETIPTLRPVKGPGPIPTTTPVTSDGPGARLASAEWMLGARCSA